jgi:two-component system OmpR family sensor kinase
MHSLRFKLISIYGATIALLIVCAGLILYQIVTYRSYHNFDDVLLSDARFFVSHIKLEVDGFKWSLKGLNPHLATIIREFEPYAVVTNLDGTVLHESAYNKQMQTMIHRGGLDTIIRQRSGFGLAVTAHGAVLRFVSLEMPSGVDSSAAIMHVGRSTEGMKWVLNKYSRLYLWSVPVMLALSVAAGWFLTGRALRPFKDITKTAEQISSKNLNAQIVTKYKEEEIQALAKSFNTMVGRLNRSFQQMRRFNADAAHELRIPLSILRAETELLLRSPNPTKDEIQSALESTLEELDRLTRIVNDMLILSEAEAGEQVLLKEPIHLRTFIEELINQMATLAATRDIQIELHNMPDIQMEADRLLIRRAMFNILDNAIKYSKENGKVEVSATVQDTMARLQIRDYGIGIAPDDLPNIFDRLFRADRARNRINGGAGLGLSMARWIIEAHQGTISVSSTPNQGSRFEIALPISSGIG